MRNSTRSACRKEKAPRTGEVVRGARKRTPGKSCSQTFLRLTSVRYYLETLTDWIAPSWARASRASMGANITLPPRRRLTIIPAIAGRMLATPCALGRISVTVDLAITGEDKAMRVPVREAFQNQWVNEWRRLRAVGHVTCNVRK
jgi:hypothetical protein